jgi:hypothetical protein
MKMTWHSSACVSFESSETKVLFDPWLKSSAYLGSWHQWPPARESLDACLETKYDFIVYTHFHSDHWDPQFLKEYLNIWRERGHYPVILLAKNSWGQLAKSIGDVVRDDAKVVLVESGIPYSLNSRGFKITSWVSDFCDPIACGKQIPCFSSNPTSRAIDSVALIEDESFSVLNLNDAVASHIDIHLQKIGIRADLVMGVFAAAGSFPQCMSNISAERKVVEKEAFLSNAMERLVKAGDRLKAKYLFPFAGQYILGGRLAALNSERAIIPASIARNQIQTLTSMEVFTLNTNESCTMSKGELTQMGASYSEPNNETMATYLEEKNSRYNYELRPLEKVNIAKLSENIEMASLKLAAMYSPLPKFNYSIRIRAIDSDFYWSLEFGKDLKYGKFENLQSDHSEISLDLRLLDGCLRRKSGYEGFTSMHWNQAHIGSHLTFNQTTYNPTAHYLLNFLHI